MRHAHWLLPLLWISVLPAQGRGGTDRPAAKVPQDSAAGLIERRLGVRFSVLGSKIRRRIISTDTPYGFAVRVVTKGSPAARAGLAPGVVVLRVDGKPLRELVEFAELLRRARPGALLELTCARRKQRRRVLDRHPWEEVVLKLRLPDRGRRRPAPIPTRPRRWI